MALPRSLPKQIGQLSPLRRQRLWLQVLIGMGLGIAVGVVLGPGVGLVDTRSSLLIGNWLALPGRLFLTAIQFVVVPLVVASVIRGIAGGERQEGFGRMSTVTLLFFVATTVAAAVIGLLIAYLIGPGHLIDGGLVTAALADTVDQAPPIPADVPAIADLPDLILSLFPQDPLSTFVSGNMLQIVIVAAIFGVALTRLKRTEAAAILDLLASIQAVSMVIVRFVLQFAPIAVFGLMASITARIGFQALLGTAAYLITVLLGLAILFALYLAIAMFVGRRPLVFLAKCRDVILLAFSTSSSAAVMPLTMTTAEKGLRVRASVTRFVVPLGATVNMAGTALYQGVATVFLAQVFGVEIGLAGAALVVVMATGSAIGSPGTPGVGIVILATILSSVGIPAAGIAIILGVDRLLDMSRTAVNVLGDLVACVVVDKATRNEPAASAPSDAAAGTSESEQAPPK